MAEGFKRKISAILVADVAGYGRLLDDDATATILTLESYRETAFSLTQQHKGRVVDSPGDTILSEFYSVVDAVQCAIEIQKVIKAKNLDLPDNRKMNFRIGINLGEVIERKDRLYGVGINVAAVIDGLADPGGICISGSAYEQIERELSLDYEYLGEHISKSISRPVKVYKILPNP